MRPQSDGQKRRDGHSRLVKAPAECEASVAARDAKSARPSGEVPHGRLRNRARAANARAGRARSSEARQASHRRGASRQKVTALATKVVVRVPQARQTVRADSQSLCDVRDSARVQQEEREGDLADVDVGSPPEILLSRRIWMSLASTRENDRLIREARRINSEICRGHLALPPACLRSLEVHGRPRSIARALQDLWIVRGDAGGVSSRSPHQNRSRRSPASQ